MDLAIDIVTADTGETLALLAARTVICVTLRGAGAPKDYPASRASSFKSMSCRCRNRNEASVPVQITPHTV